MSENTTISRAGPGEGPAVFGDGRDRVLLEPMFCLSRRFEGFVFDALLARAGVEVTDDVLAGSDPESDEAKGTVFLEDGVARADEPVRVVSRFFIQLFSPVALPKYRNNRHTYLGL